MVRPCTAALNTFLDAWDSKTSAAQCDLYTFTFTGGEVLRYSGYQTAVSAPEPETDDPMIYFPIGPPISRTKTKTQIGVVVDQLDVTIGATSHELVFNGGVLTWQRAMRRGMFDGAKLDLWRCFMSPPGTVIGTLRWFYGPVSTLDVGRTKVIIHVKSLLNVLNTQMPRRVVQASCNHVFGDVMCGFDRTTMQQTITATTGTLQSQVHYSGSAPDPTTLYDNGTLIGATGANGGYTRSITRVEAGVVSLLDPWVFPIELDDTFTMLPGCPHTTEACEGTFDNLDRYGGMPYVPPPESAV